jgi:hypothetical protein
MPHLIAADFDKAWNTIRPIIFADDEQKTTAMRTAPLIFVAKIQDTDVHGEPRQVEKPASVGGPMVPTIPLYLARISAKPLLFLRGSGSDLVEFYSWVWASGKHGGPRLFHPTPDSFHILFVMADSGYLHTVGDYPSYDIELGSHGVQKFIAVWESGVLPGADLLERIVAAVLRAELESVDEKDEAVGYWLNINELVDLTSAKFVASQLTSLCKTIPNPRGRAQACSESTEWNRLLRVRGK